MAGSIAVTTSDLGGGITKYSVDWTSDAAGAVSANSFNVKRGELLQVRFVPDGGGTQPTDLYDVTAINNADGANVIPGLGANLSNTTATDAVPVISTYFRIWLDGGALTPVIANAGNAKGGVIVLLVR